MRPCAQQVGDRIALKTLFGNIKAGQLAEKRAGDWSSVIECALSMHNTLSWLPRIGEQKRKLEKK
jgi:hypothetical protein